MTYNYVQEFIDALLKVKAKDDLSLGLNKNFKEDWLNGKAYYSDWFIHPPPSLHLLYDFDINLRKIKQNLKNAEEDAQKLKERIAELEDAIEETTQELDKHEEKLTQYMRNKIKFKSTREVPKNLAGAIMPVIPQHRDSVEVNLNAWILESSVLQVRINACSGEILIEYHGGWHVLLAEYNSVTKFKAAIRELAAAIKRGDKQFKFPTDVQDK